MWFYRPTPKSQKWVYRSYLLNIWYHNKAKQTLQTTEQFALFLVEACTQPDMIKDITTPNHAELADVISAEVRREMMPTKDLLDIKDN